MHALDHVFVCCSEEAPEAEALVDLGLTEGSSNTHPGQGTASRRFFFKNAYIELLWVTDPGEARSPAAAPTRLWARWSQRSTSACPFGLVLRPSDGVQCDPPFASWAYHPPYLPLHLAIDVAEDTPLDEPALFYIRFARSPEQVAAQPLTHALGITRITGLEIGLPGAAQRSAAADAVAGAGLVSFSPADAHVMTVCFDGTSAGRVADLRPSLPLVLRW